MPIPARIGIVWAALVALFIGKAWLTTALFGPDYALPRHAFMAILATLAVVPFILLARRYLDRQPIASLGLEDAHAARSLAIGAVSWLAPFAVALAVCLLTGIVAVEPMAPWGEILLFVPALAVLVLLLEALPEELAFRGYLYRNLVAVMPVWAGVVVQAALFALWGTILWTFTSGYVPLERLVMFFFVGLVLGMIRAQAGSIWAAVGLHVAFQTVAQLMLSVERGHFAIANPELFQLVVLGIVPFALAATIVDRLHGGRTDWTRREPEPA
jgi:membrane protease YdiL (CAAX protease family)